MGRLLALAIAVVIAAAAPAARAGAFSDWAAIFVAADDHAHSGAHSEVFDNARRDVAAAFVRAGFSAANMAQFSVHPEHYPGQKLDVSSPDAINAGLTRLANQAKGGCLVYVTSHGGPDGLIIMGDTEFTAAGLARMIDDACGARPTVVIVSACYSGAFIPPLSSPDRMVLTAAAPDRTSFGCGESDIYTYFDTCLLQSLPHARDFPTLGQATQACVAARETELGASPPSEPQLWIGPELAADIPLLAFAASP
ncbi:MAG TPA: C13 family peptidase [Caulobacteraceae bacterium]|nr:C13 family peptidase [Caulobacteraceae bacterium]